MKNVVTYPSMLALCLALAAACNNSSSSAATAAPAFSGIDGSRILGSSHDDLNGDGQPDAPIVLNPSSMNEAASQGASRTVPQLTRDAEGHLQKVAQNDRVAERAVGDATRPVASKAKAPETLCAQTERIVFSCVLENGRKSVSMCASGDLNQGQGRFYYAYGRPTAVELTFPPAGAPSGHVFARTHLVFAGNTGGYAYSFVNNEYKYIVFSISGSFDAMDAGVIVQHVGDGRVAQEMQCKKKTIIDPDDKDVLDATLKWRNDTDIASHGLPSGR